MRHANHNALNTKLCGLIDHCLHTRDQALSTLQAEALCCCVLGGQKVLKHGAPGQTIQDASLSLLAVRPLLCSLDALTHPVTTITVRYMHVLVSNASAVRLFQTLKDVPQLAYRAILRQEPLHTPSADEELAVKVCLRETIECRVQLNRNFAVVQADGIKLRLQVTIHLICADQQHQPHAFLNRLMAKCGTCGTWVGQRWCLTLLVVHEPLRKRVRRSRAKSVEIACPGARDR
mmetsp:Transcript_33303/g.72663  ORF Transcript_33303/g.72663 Transcript_33303/m.72663 type:complete len:233 (+) Transcript_33303:672-1370(+)